MGSCGWGFAMHLKTTLTRGGYMHNILFDSNIIYNNTGFLLIETDYQSNHDNDLLPPYPTTDIRNISFIDNSGLGHAISMNFDCSEFLPCNDIQVKNNWLLDSNNDDDDNSSPYHCSYVQTYELENNSPPGLDECM